MAVESILGGDQAGGLQQVVVGIETQVSGSDAACRTQRGGFRSGSEISRRGECALHSLFPGGHLSISISSCALQSGGVYWPAVSLLDLWQQGGGRALEEDGGNGAEQAVAGRAGGHWRGARAGCIGDIGI